MVRATPAILPFPLTDFFAAMIAGGNATIRITVTLAVTSHSTNQRISGSKPPARPNRTSRVITIGRRLFSCNLAT